MNQTYHVKGQLKSAFFLAALLTVSSLIFGQQGTPYYSKSLEDVNIREVEVSTSGGSISVINENAEKLRIEVYIKGNNNRDLTNSEIEERLNERYELLIETSDNKVKAVAKQKGSWNDWKNSLNISFKVFVPKMVNTKLKTSGGSIYLKGLEGNQDFATSGGSLKLENIKGPVDGRTSGGSISVNGADGNMELKTSGGSISAKNCKGTITLATSGGSLNLEQIKGTIDARTSGGSISADDISGELKTHTSGGSINLAKMSCSIDASTSGGTINADVVQLGSYVRLKTSAGSINLTIPGGKGLDLDLSGTKVSAPTLTNFTGNATSREITGTMQGGGIPISARTSGGTVNISFK
jgi:hypothetical protein